MGRFQALAVLTVFVVACNGGDFSGSNAQKAAQEKTGLETPANPDTPLPEDATHQNVPVGQAKTIAGFMPGVTPTGCVSADPNIATCDMATEVIKGLAPGQTDVTVQTATGSTVVHVTVTPVSTSTSVGTTDSSDPGLNVGQADVTAAIDTACEYPGNGDKPDSQLGVTPKNPPLPPTVPADCQAAIEFNDLTQAAFQLTSVSPQGSSALTLEVDVATYTAADRMKLSAVLQDGTERVIFDTCRLRTWDKGDPTKGKTRPPEATIRDFRPQLPKGTKTLKFDFTGAQTPTYMRVRGLCEFTRTPQFYTGSPSKFFSIRPVN